MSLADDLAEGAGVCPIPASHDRLNEAHHWWHEMAAFYHEPRPFRYAFGAWIQAARSVTFLLQKEKKAFPGFDWYEEWVERAKESPTLNWLKNNRNTIVHEEALEPGSWVEFRCVRKKGDPYYDPDVDVQYFRISPFECTHALMGVGHSSVEDRHPHAVVRHWEVRDLVGREVLELSAEIFDELRLLLATAHHESGAQMTRHAQEDGPNLWMPGRLPCMQKLHSYQVARFSTRRGKTVWTNEPAEVRARRRRTETPTRADG